LSAQALTEQQQLLFYGDELAAQPLTFPLNALIEFVDASV
jgi:hypothetical protein